MDTFTQIALGACIGQAVGYKTLGKKALIFGGLGGLIPDLDVLYTPLFGDFGGWLYHRHITHALWFGPLLGSFMGYGLWRHYGRQAGHLAIWISILVLSIFTHPLLDLFTIYGTQLLAPFSDKRFEISGVCIIDPIYTVTLLLAMGLRGVARLRYYAHHMATAALILTTAYLFYGWHLNTQAVTLAKSQLDEQHIPYTKVEAFTTIFQPFLRRVVATEAHQTRVGFISTFSPAPIVWDCRGDIPEREKAAILATESAKTFDWFSGSHLSFRQGNTVNNFVVTDSRYGVPGDSNFGWWGQIYEVQDDANSGSAQATYLGKFHADRDASFHAIGQLFRAAYGLDNSFLMKQDKGCE